MVDKSKQSEFYQAVNTMANLLVESRYQLNIDLATCLARDYFLKGTTVVALFNQLANQDRLSMSFGYSVSIELLLYEYRDRLPKHMS